MNASVKSSIIIRPISSKRGLSVLLFLLLIGLFFAAISFLIFVIAPGGDAKARIFMKTMGIVSLITIIIGIILYFVFPRVLIIFDSSRKEAIIKSNSNINAVVPFSSLQPFQIYELVRGYAHQYYCRNASFGEFSDLFFSTFHKKTLKKAKELALLTRAGLIDCDG
jgi:hypothetical protein